MPQETKLTHHAYKPEPFIALH